MPVAEAVTNGAGRPSAWSSLLRLYVERDDIVGVTWTKDCASCGKLDHPNVAKIAALLKIFFEEEALTAIGWAWVLVAIQESLLGSC